jgi:hypothetical protein
VLECYSRVTIKCRLPLSQCNILKSPFTEEITMRTKKKLGLKKRIEKAAEILKMMTKIR